MTTNHEVMQQALEALETGEFVRSRNTMAALRARLAEPETCKPALQVEAAMAPPARLPLTDKEIDKMWRKFASEEGFTTAQFVRNFARAIERKITGGNDE